MASPSSFLGIDAGGSKTQVLLVDPEGNEQAQATGGPANHQGQNWASGIDALFNTISQAFTAFQSQFSYPPTITRSCLGLAGLDTPSDLHELEATLRRHQNAATYFGPSLIAVNDAYVGFKSGSQSPWGIAIIAGTGTNCYGVTATGTTYSVGSWGYLLGDQASGFALGQAIAQAVMSEYDGRDSPSALTPAVLDFLHLNHPTDFYTWVYQHPHPVAALASLAPLVALPALAQHPVIVSCLNRSRSILIYNYQTLLTRMNLDPTSTFDLVLLGGLFSLEAQFLEPLTQALTALTPTAHIFHPVRSPVWGAADLARSWKSGELLPELALTLNL